MMLLSRELMRLFVLAVITVGLVAVDLRVLIPFALIGYLLLRPRRPDAWDANDEP